MGLGREQMVEAMSQILIQENAEQNLLQASEHEVNILIPFEGYPRGVYTAEGNEGGAFATPALGKGDLGDLVYVHMTRTPNDGATLIAVDKQTGEIAWTVPMGSGGWSSPVCVYAQNGKGYVIVGSSSGALRLYDGRTGAILSICDLEGNIEGSPAVFDDMLVVGTRGRRIFGVRIKGGESA